MSRLDPSGRVLIVGGGVAAHVVATTLRSEGFGGRIEVLTKEPHPPYDRPPLSKEALRSEANAVGSFGVDYDELDIVISTDTTVFAVGQDAVHSSAGEHPYDRLVLATGSDPVVLPGQQESPRAICLRTRADAERLRRMLHPGARMALVGAGWIGAEVATAAVARGCAVTMIDTAETPLAGALPPEVGRRTVAWYDEESILLRLGVQVEEVTLSGVRLVGGDHIEADVVVVGVGARPATSYLRHSDLDVRLAADGSVLADARLQVEGAGVYAVGDIVTWPSPRFGAIRTEHWDHAVQSARHVARGLLGQQVDYDPVPYVWSDQWGRHLQYVGHHSADDRVVIHEGKGKDGWTAWWVAGEQVTAVLAVDQPRLIHAARRAIERGILRMDPGATEPPALATHQARGTSLPEPRSSEHGVAGHA